jgi:nitric oxide dioxygenase
MIIKEEHPMALQVDWLGYDSGEVAGQGEAFAASCYERLFALAPEGRSLFAAAAMEQQEQKLLAALALVMEHLGEPEKLASVLRYLGERQMAYEVTADGLEVGGAALLETLRLLLGEQWTPELEDAWADAFGTKVTVMLEAGE